MTAADNADAAVFTSTKTGCSSSATRPTSRIQQATNATANTYKVVVVACDVALVSDACPDTGQAGYHPVTVMVTAVNEPGKVTLGHQTPQMGRRSTWSAQPLTATASDGDITNADSDLYGRQYR